MECSPVSDKLYEYIYDELDENTMSLIEEHLKSCSACHEHYMELKKLLIDDMQGFMGLKNEIKVPDSLNPDIEALIKPRKKINFIKFASAACILFLLTFSTPVLAYYILQIPPIDKYIDLDKSIVVDFEEGRGQLIQKSTTMNGITFTVDGIIPKKDRTSILFTIKVPKDSNINYGMPEDGFNTVTITDQFGIKYRPEGSALTLKSVNDDGEVKGIYDIEPLKFWSYKLNIRITAIELGLFNEDMSAAKVKNAYGNWNVNFYINRSNTRR